MQGYYNRIFINLAITVILFRISWTDLQERRIGKKETAILMGLGTFLQPTWYDGLMGGVVCGGFPELINLIFADLSGLGGGDICLMFAAGWILGIEKGLYALLIAGMTALGLSVILKIFGKELKEGIPFGPFLALGIWSMVL